MKFAPPSCTIEEFVADDAHAPLGMRIALMKSKRGYALRVINAGFVARGKWDVLVSKKFSDSMMTKKGGNANGKGGGGMLKRSGFLTKEEAAKRGLKSCPTKTGATAGFTPPSPCSTWSRSSHPLCPVDEDRRRHRLGGPHRSEFDKDAEYPNIWRAITKDAVGNPVLGPKNLYSGSGFYLKATRLKAPEDAIFFEFHSAYNEPHGWFDGGKDLRQKLPSIIKFQVEEFRGKFSRASR